MRFRWHYFYSILFILIPGVILSIYFRERILIPMSIIAVVWGSLFPDSDHKFDKSLHRNFVFHSIFFPLIFWLSCWGYIELQLLMSFLMFGTGVHLFCDIHLRRHKQVGFYTLKFFKYYSPLKVRWKVFGLSGRLSTLFYMCNFLISLAFLTFTLVIFLH